MTAFRFPAGRSFARSSASAASRAATSRSPFFVWNSSFVMSSAARIAALCVSTIGPCDSTFFRAWSTYAATSRVYSGGRSERTVYSSPPIITLTACFFVLTARPPPCPGARRRAPAAPATPSAALARLLLEEGEPREEIVHSPARRLDPLAQHLVLLLKIGDAVPDLGIELHGGAAAPAALPQLGFRLECARAPTRQLLGHVAQDGLQLVEHLHIRPLSVVRQARPPGPSARARAVHPRRARGACARDRGTCSARRRCAAPPGSHPPVPDTRRRLPAARAAALRRVAARRPPPPRSRPPVRATPGRAPAAAAAAEDDTPPAPGGGPSPTIVPRTRTAAQPRRGRPLRPSLTTPPPSPPVAPLPPPPPPRLQLPRCTSARRRSPLTQSGASSPISPYQVLSHRRTNAAAAGRPSAPRPRRSTRREHPSLFPLPRPYSRPSTGTPCPPRRAARRGCDWPSCARPGAPGRAAAGAAGAPLRRTMGS